MRAQPTLRVTPPYYDDPDYIDALAVSIDTHLATLPFKPELIVASFHGMPQEYIDKGDPYQAQCVATTEALRKRLGSTHKAAADLPVALRLRRVAAALHRQDHRAAGQGRREAASRSSRPASRPIAWKRWKRSRRKTPRFSSTMAARSLPPFPASTTATPAWT